MDNKLIEEAIEKFEENNHFKISEYISDEADECDDRKRDNYIGSDIFKQHIEEWLGFFAEEDKHVFLELLKRYTYYTENKFRTALKYIVTEVQRDIGDDIEWDSVFFVTFPSKDGVKSGGDDIRSFLQMTNIGKIRKDNIISEADKNKEKLKENAKVIVFLDDIVGSGKTMYGNVKKVCEELEEISGIKKYIGIIHANEKILKKKEEQLKKIGIDVGLIVYKVTEKCFKADYYFERDIALEYKKIVEKYEIEIQSKKLDIFDKDYVLGFEDSQALVSFLYNTPNNTLSNFWRPSMESIPLFMRTTYSRTQVSDMIQRRKNNVLNAYQIGCKR